jgi:hypothetical protein
MTSHTKHYIEPADIAGLRLECKHCKTSVSFTLSQNFDFDKLNDCPSCGKTWVSNGYATSIQAEIRAVVGSINLAN